MAGYHSSVLVGGEEYYFGPFGICYSPKLASHEAIEQMRILRIGITPWTGSELVQTLSDQFSPGTYDILRKNCNAFADCALYFLCGKRLDPSFRRLEDLGLAIDDNSGLLRSFSLGNYVPNDKAASFDLEDVIDAMCSEYEDEDGSSSGDDTELSN